MSTSDTMPWWRAVASGVAIFAVAAAALVFAPNLVLTRMTGISRNWRVSIASVWFLAALTLLGWGLRRLQAHHEI